MRTVFTNFLVGTAADKIVPSRVSVGLLNKQIKSMLGFFNHFS